MISQLIAEANETMNFFYVYLYRFHLFHNLKKTIFVSDEWNQYDIQYSKRTNLNRFHSASMNYEFKYEELLLLTMHIAHIKEENYQKRTERVWKKCSIKSFNEFGNARERFEEHIATTSNQKKHLHFYFHIFLTLNILTAKRKEFSGKRYEWKVSRWELNIQENEIIINDTSVLQCALCSTMEERSSFGKKNLIGKECNSQTQGTKKNLNWSLCFKKGNYFQEDIFLEKYS